jgi:hypothetical protein
MATLHINSFLIVSFFGSAVSSLLVSSVLNRSVKKVYRSQSFDNQIFVGTTLVGSRIFIGTKLVGS